MIVLKFLRTSIFLSYVKNQRIQKFRNLLKLFSLDFKHWSLFKIVTTNFQPEFKYGCFRQNFKREILARF